MGTVVVHHKVQRALAGELAVDAAQDICGGAIIDHVPPRERRLAGVEK